MKLPTKLLVGLLAVAVVLPNFGDLRVSAASGVAINSSNFPDSNFRSAISAYDTDRNGYLSDSERNITNVHCENMAIRSIVGIEHFPNIEGLWCLNNEITSMDLSGNPHLKGLWCSNNQLTSLDLSGNPELLWVYCFDNQLTYLNVSNNPELAYIECNGNHDLGSLDFSQNTKLENIFASECGLTSLDVSNCPLLCDLTAFKNDLRSLDLSNNPELRRLDIWWNENLGDVDISNLHKLESYNCAKTGATRIDMSNSPNLMWLVAGFNGETLTYVNVRNNSRLADLRLDCDYSLNSLDLSGNPQLYFLYAYGTHLDTIDISHNSRLVAAYTRGQYIDEDSNLGGPTYAMLLDYGGSDDPFDQLKHIIVLDDATTVITGNAGTNVPDSYINTNDGHSSSDSFATRGQAIQVLYEMAGSPSVSGGSRFTDISGSQYANAIKWGEQHNVCFGYPNICSNTFCPDEIITKEDFALMAHRTAGVLDLGTALDYGRTDWYDDFFDIEYYGWAAFTWAVQWKLIMPIGNNVYPHGRMTVTELQYAVDTLHNIDPNASYSSRVNGNGTSGSSGGATPAQQFGWIQNSDGNWWYRFPDGSFPRNSWQAIDGEWYYFNNTGFVVYGWNLIDGEYYYFDSLGHMKTGWINYNNNYYYCNGQGKMIRNSWATIDGKYYYFDGMGAMKTGWLKVNGQWYYLDNLGAMKTGWIKYNNKWYYFKANGAMATGWAAIDGKYYYFDTAGAMKTGWIKVNGQWYYLDNLGAMKTGWIKYNNNWYYFTASGAMATGWQKINGICYYFDASGIMKTNSWINTDGTWYYVNSNGAMLTGWNKIGDNWYYFSSVGSMSTGWLKYDNNWYYLNGSGVMITGTHTIDGASYTFNNYGICINP